MAVFLPAIGIAAFGYLSYKVFTAKFGEPNESSTVPPLYYSNDAKSFQNDVALMQGATTANPVVVYVKKTADHTYIATFNNHIYEIGEEGLNTFRSMANVSINMQ